MKNKYFQLADPDLKLKIRSTYGQEVGTYLLHWFKNGNPVEICRLLGNDEDGVLYIGRTSDALYRRVASLATAILSNSDESLTEPKVTVHKTLALKFFRIRKRIDIKDLFVEVKTNIQSPDEDKSILLEEYVAEFGELPPMNGDYGKFANWELF